MSLNYTIILFLFVVAVFLLSEMKKAQGLASADRKMMYGLQLILFVGILVRMVNLSFPNGFFIDGAMGGYDAWSLAHYGVDSNLDKYPVYLKSWGAGQSALYAYLAIPFIKLFGLTVESYRLPGALLGSFSILFFYWSLRKSFRNNVLLVFCLSFFLAINPWHIMKCRFALDCNIFPDILLIAFGLIILGCYAVKHRKLYYILASIALGVSAYGYGVGWFVLPLFFAGIFLYLIWIKAATPRLAIGCLAVMAVIVLPLMLFALNNATAGEAYQLGPITISELAWRRPTNFSSGDFLEHIPEYAMRIFKMVVLGIDPVFYDTAVMYPFGVFYNIWSLGFMFAGFYYIMFNRERFGVFAIIWLLSCSLMFVFISPNLNRWNAVWFPLILITAYGLYSLIKERKIALSIVLSVYLISFSCFMYTYMRSYNSGALVGAGTDAKPEIEFAQGLGMDHVYYPREITHVYILFFAPMSPYVFNHNIERVLYQDPVNRFANVTIGLPDSITPLRKTAYVLSNKLVDEDTEGRIATEHFKVKKGEHFTVLWND